MSLLQVQEPCSLWRSRLLRQNTHFLSTRGGYVSTCFLLQVIDVEKSCVQYLGTKVEVKLKKAEPMSWRHLAVPQAKQTSAQDGEGDNDSA